MKTPDSANTFIQSAITAIYQKLAAGKDVSLSERLRLEGKIELLIEQDLLEASALEAWVGKAYQEAFGEPVHGAFWQICHDNPGFTLPVKMQEAPVYKG